MVKVHLYKVGFKLDYWIWIEHSEERPHVYLHVQDICIGISSNGADVAQVEQFMSMQKMVFDALRQHELVKAPKSNNMEEPPNEET